MVKRKQLNDRHTLIFTSHFPYYGNFKGGHKALLGIGGNIGDVKRRFEHLFFFFKRFSFIKVIETSPILKIQHLGILSKKIFITLWC